MAFSCRAATSVGGGVRAVLRRLPSPPAATNIPITAACAPIRVVGSIPHPCYRRQHATIHASAIRQESELDQVPSLTQDGPAPKDWKIKMLYDGDCPLCMREVNMLKKRDEVYKAIKFVDISLKDYSPDDNQGIDFETAMGRIHAILSDGTVVTDVEAFRRLYEEVGLGWVYAVTKYKPIAVLADAIYGVWAKYRLQITGRPSMIEIMESRRRFTGKLCEDNKRCNL